MVEIPKVIAVMSFFAREQAKRGYKETGNIIQLKWDMREVMDQFSDNQDHFKKLILFFMMFSDDLSLRHFISNYHEYNDSMNKTIEDRALVRSLLKRTAKGAE
jgi:hypothetical protein